MKHLRNRTSWAAIFALIAMVFTGCDSETDNITDAVVDSWDDIIGKLETCAEDRMKELADNPSLLCDGVEADYISLGDIFAVTIPMNNMGYAAVGLIFGNDAADFLSAVDSYGRNSKTKQDAKSAILKHFNSNWEDLFVGLIVLDGEFDFDYETDDLLDNSFDFDPKELYNILNERNAFSGCYGDDIPAGDTSAHNGGSKRTSSNSTGSRSYSANGKPASLEQIADNIDPEYFSHELVTYEIGSDKNMNYLMQTTASTNVPIQASGMLDNHNITLEGWITEEGTIHGRYHNSNGINLDFNGFIRPDNSLYIQLGHDYEKSEWILHPVASELPDGYFRYEGYWGKKRLSSYLTFSEGK